MKKIIIFIFSILWLSACTDDSHTEPLPTSGTNDEVPTSGFSENDVVKGRMRIKLKKDPSEQIAVRSIGGKVSTGIRALDGSATVLGITRMERTFPYAGKYEERTRREGLHLWYDVWYSDEVAATRAVDEVVVLEGIEQACPVRKIKLNAAPMDSELVQSLMQTNVRGTVVPWNDPYLNKQWNFNNPGTESWQVKGADIGLADVWEQYNGNPNIIVAVVDEGIDLNHPDLKANLWTNPNEIEGNGIDDDGNDYIDDIHGYNFAVGSSVITPYKHGTHVAGIIGASNHNGIGVCGIAGGNDTPDSGVKIMCCQILGGNGSKVNSPNAIKYAADNGAVVCQNSWGYTGEIDPADKEAIDYFIKYAGCDNAGNQLPKSPMKGGIVLFATNNRNSSDPSSATPADYEKVIGVAAIGPEFKKGQYSDYGDYIDICAPGGKGDKSTPYEADIYSTITSQSYGYLYGASMACPHVSGVAALVIEKHGVGKQGFTAGQLKEILLSTASDVNKYNPNYIGKLGSGCVNAAAALKADLPPERPTDNPTDDSPSHLLKIGMETNGTLSFSVSTDLVGNAVITIYNSTGNKVFRKSMNVRKDVTNYFDLSKLSAGYYTFLYECNGKSKREKFIKY